MVVEPVYPFQRREFNGLKTPPRSAPVNDLRLVKAVDRFGESIVVEESPPLPTEGSTPASASRPVYLIETYWLPRSL
jgi:hypothetical protein